MKVWILAQPEATGANGWAGKAMVAGLNLTSVDRMTAFYEDDARLIAAAPALLAALEHCAEALKAISSSEGLNVGLGAALEDALVAISKATDQASDKVFTK